jgi:hypothetical protein
VKLIFSHLVTSQNKKNSKDREGKILVEEKKNRSKKKKLT